jgi:hypothetical protein
MPILPNFPPLSLAKLIRITTLAGTLLLTACAYKDPQEGRCDMTP